MIGSTSEVNCMMCPVDSYCSEGSMAPTACGEGTFNNMSGSNDPAECLVPVVPVEPIEEAAPVETAPVEEDALVETAPVETTPVEEAAPIETAPVETAPVE